MPSARLNRADHVPRLLGTVPLAFLSYAALSYDTPWRLLWMCNLSNAILGAGLLLRSQRAIWIATLWLLVGIPLWILEVVASQELFVHSLMTHLLAPLIGLWAIWGRAAPSGVWKPALALGVAVNLLCRLASPGELNVNVSHTAYRGLSGLYYPVYWVFSVACLAGVLWVLERMLTRYLAAQTP